jgi:hypothetical protein
MTAVAANDEDSQAISRINGVLRGPATEVFQQLIPDLRARTRRDAYERIMSSPSVAALCFREFRAKPELFEKLVVGPDAAPITTDDQPLSCGKTLAQVVTLVVRAIAKRHFRTRLGVVRRQAAPQKAKHPGLFAVIFGAFQAPPPAPPRILRKEYSRADALYQAMRANLLYEWQVSLIPHYASLPIALVTDLGDRILEFREATQIEAMARTSKIPAPGSAIRVGTPSVSATIQRETAPIAASPRPTSRVLPSQGSTIAKIDVIRAISRQFGLSSLFGVSESDMHDLVDAVSGPGRPILASLSRGGITPPKAVVMAACIARRVGLSRFENLMTSDHTATFLRDLANQAGDHGINALESASEIQKATNRILDALLQSYLKKP